MAGVLSSVVVIRIETEIDTNGERMQKNWRGHERGGRCDRLPLARMGRRAATRRQVKSVEQPCAATVPEQQVIDQDDRAPPWP